MCESMEVVVGKRIESAWFALFTLPYADTICIQWFDCESYREYAIICSE
jgi:hypothetical protein